MKKALFPVTRRSHARGASLLEALVAILILSVGMLGIAGLMTATMSFSMGSGSRAAVGSNLGDFADRVRANPGSAVTAYRLQTTYAAQQTEMAAGLDQAQECDTDPCTPDQLAAFHLVEWRQRLALDMPGSAVFVSGQRDTAYVATVMWMDKGNLDDKKVLEKVTTCEPTMTGMAARTCCPDAAKAPDGVRCTNMAVIP